MGMLPKTGTLSTLLFVISRDKAAYDDGLPVLNDDRGARRTLFRNEIRSACERFRRYGGYLLVDVELYVTAHAHLRLYPERDADVLPLDGLDKRLARSA